MRTDKTDTPLLIRRTDLARQLGVSLPTIDRWRAEGHLPPPRRIGPASIAWPRAQIEQWIEAQPLAGEPEAASDAEASP